MEQREEKWLAKISGARFGYGGYDDAMFGVWFTFDGKYGNSDGKGAWGHGPSKDAEWTAEDRRGAWGEMIEWTLDIMKQAKVKDFNDLVGKPVEVTSINDRMDSWRILTEVL